MSLLHKYETMLTESLRKVQASILRHSRNTLLFYREGNNFFLEMDFHAERTLICQADINELGIILSATRPSIDGKLLEYRYDLNIEAHVIFTFCELILQMFPGQQSCLGAYQDFVTIHLEYLRTILTKACSQLRTIILQKSNETVFFQSYVGYTDEYFLQFYENNERSIKLIEQKTVCKASINRNGIDLSSTNSRFKHLNTPNAVVLAFCDLIEEQSDEIGRIVKHELAQQEKTTE